MYSVPEPLTRFLHHLVASGYEFSLNRTPQQPDHLRVYVRWTTPDKPRPTHLRATWTTYANSGYALTHLAIRLKKNWSPIPLEAAIRWLSDQETPAPATVEIPAQVVHEFLNAFDHHAADGMGRITACHEIGPLLALFNALGAPDHSATWHSAHEEENHICEGTHPPLSL
ncbi:hypothetical protein ABZ234_08025 [Nocardiopsis sp. NPDC006198]|uniref:hypothetical protein n=1 Tax=Nocardiopsis sp. NPDC006198 TaxID=3154472 RepID=UPI0033BEEF98